jgi:hypothetical protein
MKFNLDDLTIGDMEDLEELAGTPFDEIDWSKPNIKTLKAMIYVAGRKDNPDLTIEAVRDMKVSDLDVAEDKPNPTKRAKPA